MLLEGTGRFAANRLIIHEKTIINGVVEIEDGIVKSYYQLSEELPFTEWIGGTIELSEEKGCLIARVRG